MALLRLDRKTCSRCGSALNLPHNKLMECLAVNAEETRQALQHSKRLLQKRARLTAEHREAGRERAVRARKS
jgi:hypothetical protein